MKSEYCFKDWVVYMAILVLLVMGVFIYKLDSRLKKQEEMSTFLLGEVESHREMLKIYDKKFVDHDRQLYEFYHESKKYVKKRK